MTDPTPMTRDEKAKAAAGLARFATRLFAGAAGWAAVVATVALAAAGLAPPWPAALAQCAIATIIAVVLFVNGVRTLRYGSSLLEQPDPPTST